MGVFAEKLVAGETFEGLVALRSAVADNFLLSTMWTRKPTTEPLVVNLPAQCFQTNACSLMRTLIAVYGLYVKTPLPSTSQKALAMTPGALESN